jgi:hypothetical protein
VLGGQQVGRAGGSGDVDAVHPRVAREDDVEEEADRPRLLAAADELGLPHCSAPDHARREAAPAHGLRRYVLQPRGDLVGSQVRALLHL